MVVYVLKCASQKMHSHRFVDLKELYNEIGGCPEQHGV
jgi:hypothetical protein